MAWHVASRSALSTSGLSEPLALPLDFEYARNPAPWWRAEHRTGQLASPTSPSPPQSPLLKPLDPLPRAAVPVVVKKTPRERPRRSPAAGVRAIESLLDMLPDAQYQWRHFKEYFGLLYEFGALGAEEREWLLSRNTVMRYIDFY